MNPLFTRLVRLSLACVATALVPLGASQPRLGVVAGAAWPTGSTRSTFTDETGYTLGAYADWEQRPGHTLRLALDGCFYPGSRSTPLAEATGDRDQARSQSLTLNYVYAPHAFLHGFYVVAGGGAMNLQRLSGDLFEETGVKLAWNAGFGVDFNDRWGLLARYHAVTSRDRDLGTFTAGLTYRF